MRGLGISALLGLLAAVLALSGGAIGLTYEEVTDDAGIAFQTAGEVHGETQEWPAFPEIMGPGVCMADLDGDGYEDLYFVNMRYNPENPETSGWIDDVDPTNELYRNDGDGTFTEIADGSVLANGAFGYGCSVADYDGDGHLDVYVTNFGENALYRNLGDGTFENVTSESGAAGDEMCSEDHRCMSTASTWGDYDGDGDLDLFVGNYVDTSLTDQERSPTSHTAQENWLFRNDGDGTFTEVAETAGVDGDATESGSKTLGAVWLDADGDGDLDLYVANDLTDNEYYRNDGDGTFTERTFHAGLDDDRAGMGVTAQDYDGDADPDLFFTHYETETNGFYENLGDGSFLDRSGEDDQVDSIPYVGWGTAFQDLDLDRHPDIVVANGHTESTSDDYGQPFQAYRQEPVTGEPSDPVWVNASGDWGLSTVERKVTRGLAVGDVDLDGDVDLVAGSNANDTAQLVEASDVDGHPLTIELAQPGSNPDAVGARITVTVDGHETHRVVRAGASYLSQHSLKATFGLGEATHADEVTVRWPDGESSSFSDVEASRVVRIDRGLDELVNDTIAPETSLAIDGTPGDGSWWVSPVEVSVEAEDRGVEATSGVVETEIALEDGDWQTATTISLDRGVHRVHHRATDATGNQAPRSTTLVKVDTEPPSVQHRLEGTLGDEGWYVSENVTVLLEGEDATSGIDRFEYRIDDDAWQPYDGDGIEITDDGHHDVRYRAVDEAGHSEEGAVTVPVDHTPPDVSFLSPSSGDVFLVDERIASAPLGPATVLVPSVLEGFHDPLAVTVRADDATSGLDQVRALANQQPLGPARAAEPYAWPWAVHEERLGSHQLTVEAEDIAGNLGSAHLPVWIVSATKASGQATVDEGPATYVPG